MIIQLLYKVSFPVRHKLVVRSYVTAPCGISQDIWTKSGEPRPQNTTCTSLLGE